MTDAACPMDIFSNLDEDQFRPIDPAAYMNLLKAAYPAIKQACPSMIVVSGALTPTGKVGVLTFGPPDDGDPFEMLGQALRELEPNAVTIPARIPASPPSRSTGTCRRASRPPSSRPATAIRWNRSRGCWPTPWRTPA